MKTMRMIVIPTREGQVDDHFGHCAYYTVYTVDEKEEIVKTERLDSPEGCGCKSDIAEKMQAMGITLMLAGNMGDGAFHKLRAHGIEVVRGCSGPAEEVIQRYLRHELKDSAIACDHHDCGHHGEEKGKPSFRVITDF